MTGETKQVAENAAPPSPPSRRVAPNYAAREETMKIAKRIMEERAEVFRRLADA